MCFSVFKPIWAKLPDSNLDDVVVDDDNDEQQCHDTISLKPNSITLSGRRQVRGWSQIC